MSYDKQMTSQNALANAKLPDLYKPMYSPKVVAFFDKLLDQQNNDRKCNKYPTNGVDLCR